MDIPTSIIEISGTLYVCIPKAMVKEHGFTTNTKANIMDVRDNLLEIHIK